MTDKGLAQSGFFDIPDRYESFFVRLNRRVPDGTPGFAEGRSLVQRVTSRQIPAFYTISIRSFGDCVKS